MHNCLFATYLSSKSQYIVTTTYGRHKLTFAFFFHQGDDQEQTCILCRRGTEKGRQIICEDILILRSLSSCKRYRDILNICSTFSRQTQQIHFFSHFCFTICYVIKKQIEKRQRLMVDIITIKNDLHCRQFLDENFFRIAARSIISLDKRIAFLK